VWYDRGVEAERREIVFPRALYTVLAVFGVGYVVYWLRGVLTPILLAFAIAYVFDPVVDRLEAWKIPRPLGIAIVMLANIVAVALFVVLVIPTIVADMAGVAKELPGHAARWLGQAEHWLLRYGITIPHSSTEWLEQLRGHADKIASNVVTPVGTALTWVVGGTASAIGAAVGAMIVPVLAVYLLYDFDNITAGMRDLIPRRFRRTVTSYARDIDAVLGHFIRGQLIVMSILAVLYGGAYTLLGVRLAVPIGIAAGILNFVPYLGSAFALGAGLLMSLIGGAGWGQLAGVAIAYAVIQSLEGFVITPRVVGNAVGLRDVWVLLALFVGGELFGFLGVLLALPAAAVAKIFVARAMEAYRSTELFLAGPPSQAPPPEGGAPLTARSIPLQQPAAPPASSEPPPASSEPPPEGSAPPPEKS
jgi:predicted PurR-regulated permease PerM